MADPIKATQSENFSLLNSADSETSAFASSLDKARSLLGSNPVLSADDKAQLSGETVYALASGGYESNLVDFTKQVEKLTDLKFSQSGNYDDTDASEVADAFVAFLSEFDQQKLW